MEAEVKQRCLLCRSEVLEVKTEEASNLSSVLSKHLRVIFLLRKVLQVPVSLLARFLASCPNVDGWVGACERCQGLVRECRQVHRQIVELKRRWVECRLLVVKVVKETADSSGTGNVHDDTGLLDIDKEIRTFVENHEFSTWQNPFIQGDLMAEQKNAGGNFHETCQDFGAFDFEGDIDMDDNSIDYHEDEEAMNKEHDPHDTATVEVENRRGRTGVSPKKKKNNKYLNWKGKTEQVTLCSKSELIDNVLRKKPVERIISMLESRQETPFTEDQKLLIKRSISVLFRSYKGEKLRNQKKTGRKKKSDFLSYQGDFVVGFPVRGRIIKHPLPEDGSYQMKCYVAGCLQICRTLPELQAHQKKNHTEEERKSVPESAKTYQCTKCLEVFRLKASMVKHLKRVHNPQKKVAWTGIRVMCLVEGCSKIWLSIKSLQHHQEMDHTAEEVKAIPKDARIHQCVQCQGLFLNQQKLKEHRIKVHGEARPPPRKATICDLCGVAVKNIGIALHQQRNLNCRRLQGLPDLEKAFVCHHCGKGFLSQAALRRHIRAHEQEQRKYAEICDICGRGVSSKTDLRKHKAKVHKIGDFPCTEEGCGKVFWNQEALDFHVGYFHRGDGGYFCEVKECGRRFRAKYHLANHMNQDHLKGEAPYKCKECGKAFYYSEYLSQHVGLVHRGQKKKRRTERIRGSGNEAVMRRMPTKQETEHTHGSSEQVWNMSNQT